MAQPWHYQGKAITYEANHYYVWCYDLYSSGVVSVSGGVHNRQDFTLYVELISSCLMKGA